MKRFYKILSLMMAILMLLSVVAVVSAGAITVEKDGTEYFLCSRTPTTGDINVLMIRIGFADYSVDDEEYPADSEESLLSYFDGSEDSVNRFFENASYGKLHLHCDQVFSYNAQFDRDDYDRDNFEAKSDIYSLMAEAINALTDETGIEKYDSDADGYLDFVVFDYAGPNGKWGSAWWPHVNRATDLEVLGKQISSYSFLKGEATVFKHEFGHILGAADYYSTADGTSNVIMTYDMMSINSGDHNGFTKWTYGWIDDEDIVFADKETGDMTVELTPVDSSQQGKKIAVVAPLIDRSNGFLDEYFLVEYDSGAGNNAAPFGVFSLEPGFRIFHVNAKSDYYGDDVINFLKDNSILRNCLIHNVKNEYKRPSQYDMEDMFFREGDSLTPEGYPNTGMLVDDVYNGLFSGISFTDFVTGDTPSFRVSFSDEQPLDEQPVLTLSYDELDSDMKMTLSSDKALTLVESRLAESNPYLLDENGNKLSLVIKNEDQTMFHFSLSYPYSYPAVFPNTEYTVVIPQGCFKSGYNQEVPEFRDTVKTSDYSALTAITALPYNGGNSIYSNIFTVSDTTFGRIKLPNIGDGRFLFIEYNLNGEEVSSFEFDAPDYDTSVYTYQCIVKTLNDGNFSLELCSMSGTDFFVKIDRRGNILSDVFAVGDNSLYGYADCVSQVDFDLYKDGLCKVLFSNSKRNYVVFSIDFKNEPKIEYTTLPDNYFPIDSDTYVIKHYDSETDHMLISVYDSSDTLVSKIEKNGVVFSVFEDGGNIVLLYYNYTGKQNNTFADTYSKNGELIQSVDVTDDFDHIPGLDTVAGCIATKSGYYVIHNSLDGKLAFAFDRDWKYLTKYHLDENANLIFAGNCGLMEKTEIIKDKGMAQLVLRFAIGDVEIVSHILGDADGDKKVSVLDANAIQKHLASLSNEKFVEAAADTDSDGRITILDATYIQKWLASLPVPYQIDQPIV